MMSAAFQREYHRDLTQRVHRKEVWKISALVKKQSYRTLKRLVHRMEKCNPSYPAMVEQWVEILT